MKFLGNLIAGNGIQADPEKTTAILKIVGQPSNITELRRFMGMANQLGKFSPHLAELSHYQGTAEYKASMGVGPRTTTYVLRGQDRTNSAYCFGTV